MKLTKESGLILAFTFLAFILGTTEYVIVGLLDDVAQSLHVTVAQTGVLVSAFAVAYALGTPVALAAAARFSKRASLMAGAALVILLNIGTALAPTYSVLFLIRVVVAVCCGLCVSLAISISSDVVAEERKGVAISYITGGFSIANVLGVPIGTHFSWTAAFLFVALTGILCFLLLHKMIPSTLPPMNSAFSDTLRLLGTPRIMLAFLIPIFGIAAIFTIYTYIIPIMTDVMNIPGRWSSMILLCYGAVTVISNIIGGFVSAGNYLVKLRNVFLVHILVFLLFGITMHSSALGIFSLMAIACISFSINAAAQLYLIRLTERFVPKAKDTASSLMPIGANIGIAIGSAAGAFVMDHYGLGLLPLAAVGFSLAAFLISAYSQKFDANPKKAIGRASKKTANHFD